MLQVVLRRSVLPLVLLLLVAVIGVQTASITSEHLHVHNSQHCCALCHAGPLPLIQPTLSAALVPLVSFARVEWSGRPGLPCDVLRSSASSRAPPSLV